MVMKKETAIAFEKLEAFKGETFTVSEWHRWCSHVNISYSTFRRYAKLQFVKEYLPVTLEQLVEELNSCSGADCYGAYWEYTVIDGKPYEIIEKYKWVE